MKFGICNEMFIGRPVTDVIRHVAQLGYDGIELTPYTVSDDPRRISVEDEEEIADCAADHGIEILGLHWLLAKPEGLHLTSSSLSIRRKTQDFFRKLIEIGVNTGGRILTLGSPKQRSVERGETQQDGAQRTVEFFQGLLPDLEASGVSVALEPLEPELTNFMTRTAETCEIVDAIGNARVGMTLDTHFLRWEERQHGVRLPDAFKLADKRLLHLHIQDDNNLAPGTGTANFSEFIRTVKEIAWPGYISLETFGIDQEGIGEQAAEQTMAFFRQHLAG